MRATLPLIGEWTRLGSLHEGLDPAGPDAAEETIVGPYIFLRGVRLHRDARRVDHPRRARRGSPAAPGCCPTAGSRRGSCRTTSSTGSRTCGMHADVWMDPASPLDELPDTMATA